MSPEIGWTSENVRRTFIDFFSIKYAHEFVKSSKVIPHGDPTLQFVNAGMNQFKSIFLGNVGQDTHFAKLRRAVNSQKCIRAGGKHNDLDDVGKDTYHHTFFEMLGNWSFGDYFKEECISWAFELLVDVYKLPFEQLYATYFGGYADSDLQPDFEARDILLKFLPDHRVIPFGIKDNFWEMGKTGPCGPCVELHFDRVGGRCAADLVNQDDPDVIEVWNLVFIQYDRMLSGQLKRLPKSHIDTGMGLERLLSILQKKRSNYDTDLFLPLFEAIHSRTGCRAYSGKVGREDVDNIDTAYRVVADHVRTVSVAIADGALPENAGRGYVVRRIIRRALRYINDKISAHRSEPQPFLLSSLVSVVAKVMGNHYLELHDSQDFIISVLNEEELIFQKTITKGKKRFERTVSRLTGSTLPGEIVWELYSSYGYPLDLVRIMCEERNLTVDEAGLEQVAHDFRKASRKLETGASGTRLDQFAISHLKNLGISATNDEHKYSFYKNSFGAYVFPAVNSVIKAIRLDNQFVKEAVEGSTNVMIILSDTNFYAERGGQIYDTGLISLGDEAIFKVERVVNDSGYVSHVGTVEFGRFAVGNTVLLNVNEQNRVQIMCNHTATHLLNFALRKCVAKEVDQKGSLVLPSHLRFDYSYSAKGGLTRQQVAALEETVNAVIKKSEPVYRTPVPRHTAQEIKGVRCTGGNFPEVVTVVSVGIPGNKILENVRSDLWLSTSVELCGGTHVINTNDLESFVVLADAPLMSGIRRITCATNSGASEAMEHGQELQSMISALSTYAVETLGTHLNALSSKLSEVSFPLLTVLEAKEEIKRYKGFFDAWDIKRKKAQVNLAVSTVKALLSGKEPFYVCPVDVGRNEKALDEAGKEIKKRTPDAPFLIISRDSEKVTLLSYVPPLKVKPDLFTAKLWAEAVVACIEGRSNGTDTIARGHGPSVLHYDEALRVAHHFPKAYV